MPYAAILPFQAYATPAGSCALRSLSVRALPLAVRGPLSWCHAPRGRAPSRQVLLNLIRVEFHHHRSNLPRPAASGNGNVIPILPPQRVHPRSRAFSLARELEAGRLANSKLEVPNPDYVHHVFASPASPLTLYAL